jgi:hypothetical protein
LAESRTEEAGDRPSARQLNANAGNYWQNQVNKAEMAEIIRLNKAYRDAEARKK